MKVLFIGHFSENSGWANAAMNNVRALMSADIDVVCRNLKVTTKQGTIDPQLKPCFEKKLDGVTHCIQHVLPHHYVGTQKYEKNIGCFAGETFSIENSNWQESLLMMDEIWVPNSCMEKTIGYEIHPAKTVIVPYAFDTSKYNKSYRELNLPGIDHTFKFYTICDLTDRKNIEGLITAFHSEFDQTEPVSLVIKVRKEGVPKEYVQKQINEISSMVKQRGRFYHDPSACHKELVITENFDSEKIMSLHQTCDCFVSTSFGEAWSIPTFEAMAMGKTPICGRDGGPLDYLHDLDDESWLVETHPGICRSTDQAFPDLFTGRDLWSQLDEQDLKNAMRHFYDSRETLDKEKFKTSGLKRAKEYSYKSIGKKMKEALNGE